jgi:hypothetical protein
VNNKQFITLSSVIFLMAAMAHLLRILLGWELVIAGMTMPMGPSWLVSGFATLIGVIGLKLARKVRTES